jgi:hypothetical protein
MVGTFNNVTPKQIGYIKIGTRTLHILSHTNDLDYTTWIMKRNVAGQIVVGHWNPSDH